MCSYNAASTPNLCFLATIDWLRAYILQVDQSNSFSWNRTLGHWSPDQTPGCEREIFRNIQHDCVPTLQSLYGLGNRVENKEARAEMQERWQGATAAGTEVCLQPLGPLQHPNFL